MNFVFKILVLFILNIKTEYWSIKLENCLIECCLSKPYASLCFPGVFDTNRPGGSSPSLMNILMQLRKCVNHPYLFDGL